MPTISTFYGIAIQMFWRDHNPPHFHAIYAGDEVLIDIKALVVLEGSIARRGLLMVMDWATVHQAELLENWELCRLKQRPKAIVPLM